MCGKDPGGLSGTGMSEQRSEPSIQSQTCWWMWSLGIILLLLPTLAVLWLHGPASILRLDALSLHDGMGYYEISLSPTGVPEYCPEPMRYSRVLFPALVYATAWLVVGVVHASGNAAWMQLTFEYDGFVIPNYALLHSFIYHACLLAATWASTLRPRPLLATAIAGDPP